MPAKDIEIKGAREHNLRDVHLVLPRNQLICLTGVSGSGKSSLAFDTLYAEGQRRYVESLSSYARQFLGQMPKPDVDFIGGLSPSISISQKSAGTNPRSTVGTITEIYDYLRILFARVGTGHCPNCDRPITAQTREQIVERVMGMESGTTLLVMAPVIRGQKGEYRDLFEDLLKQGFARARVDGEVIRLSDDLHLDRQMRHHIEVVTDRITVKPSVRSRLSEAVELALRVGDGNMLIQTVDAKPANVSAEEAASAKAVEEDSAASRRQRKGVKASSGKRKGDVIFSIEYACTHCGLSFDPPSPQLFSFNSPQGMCFECDGLGQAFTFDSDLLIPDPSKSFRKGCIEPVGNWSKLGRWRRHIYKGVAQTMERVLQLDDGVLLDTPWQDMPVEHQRIWLWGTGQEHITFTWRSGSSPQKYGGTFDGIIPQLLSKYGSSKSNSQLVSLEKYMRSMNCPDCKGRRLNRQARSVKITTGSPQFSEQPMLSLPEICDLPVSDAVEFFSDVQLDSTKQLIAGEVLKEVRGRLGFLMNVGLDYLTLNRTAPTLSGGESQRIRLAGQIGCGLVGVLYILDEPSIGLHPRDNDRLLDTLTELRDVGNTVLVVEHDEDTMRHADHIVDFGPGPGVRGGEVVAQGSLADVTSQPRSVTGQYLDGKKSIPVPTQRRSVEESPRLVVRNARHNNLKSIDVEIPLGSFVCVTGVSGSGKSSLVNDILVETLRRDLNGGNGDPGDHDEITGMEFLDKMIAIDQTPIGRTPRSNPGTYIKVFDEIRKLFTQLPESKKRGYKPGRFSFNVDGGRCQACDGNGSNKLEMDFLADIWVTCPICSGHRFNRETLGVKFKDHSIADVLEMDIQQLLQLFENQPKIHHKLQTLHSVGLDYLKLGQPSPTLSGGEAQRIKLARELVKKSTGKTLYLLDEPTTGLHFADIHLLLKVLHDFVDAGNTVLIVEHNQDVIKTADWIIDLGPEGGAGGGELLAAGTPETIAKNKSSHTGRSIAPLLGMRPSTATRSTRKPAKKKRNRMAEFVSVLGARQHNLKDVSAEIPRDKMTVFCGPSGSGKSSLAMDTIYAEGQRRYVESLSSYARQFVSQMQKPDMEHIEGLSPAIAIEQQNLGNTPRSTVGTATEIYDYFRILMARGGTPYCPDCDQPVGTQTSSEVIDKVMALPEGTRVYLLAPVSIEVGQKYDALWDELRRRGFARVRVNGNTHSMDEPPDIDRRRKHRVEAVVDRVVIKASARGRIAESCEAALMLGHGVMHVAIANSDRPEYEWQTQVHSQHLACEQCGRSFEPLTPHSFSFNSHLGWCPECEGLGVQTGANSAALFNDLNLPLGEGALSLWPNLEKQVSRLMLDAMAQRLGLPLDVPFKSLAARHRRQIMHGTGETWFEVMPPGRKTKKTRPMFRFQFKGVYPGLEEAAKLSPSLRGRLNQFVDEVECSACSGSRLRDDASATRYFDYTIDQLTAMPLEQLQTVVNKWKLSKREQRIAGELLREIKSRTRFLNDVGLGYLTLARTANSLSGGEAQRIRLASQLGGGLCGVLYVLDEPTIGLHPRDNLRLLAALHRLRDLGNTLVLVEHDRDVIEGSDHVFDFGPEAGKHGGQIVAHGSAAQIGKRRASVTGPFLAGKKNIPIPSNRRLVPHANGQPPTASKKKKKTTKTKKTGKTTKTPAGDQPHGSSTDQCWLTVKGARHHNLKNVDLAIPLGRLVAITGPSGSGKSSMIEEVLYPSLAAKLHRANTIPGVHDSLEGIENINKVIRVDQHPIGNSPTSNPATYTGVFQHIRELYAQLPDAKMRGYSPRRFSFNVPGGRCDECEGNGQLCIEMHFLPDVWIPCESCQGKRYNADTLDVKFHGHSIADILEMTCGDAVKLFNNVPKIRRIIQTLCDVGLDYVTLGQSAPTLSGGESQRVKLAAELSRPDTGQTLYLLDEPTTGLHFNDLTKLLNVLQRLVDLGNSVVVIEHNLDIIKSADWVIDMGPEAGQEGGQIVVEGTPESVVEYALSVSPTKPSPRRSPTTKGSKPKSKQAKAPVRKRSVAKKGSRLRSYTGEALAPVLAAGPVKKRKTFDPREEEKIAQLEGKQLEIGDVGKSTNMPWEIDGRQWHTEDRVGRKGEAVQWDGRILAEFVDRIQSLGEFADTNWNARSVVEITSNDKRVPWFMHALTGQDWLLKLKFRVPRKTFQMRDLQQRISLPTLNQMDDLPVYSNASRVRVKNVQGPWQEVELQLHSWDEIDMPATWEFLDQAVAAYVGATGKKSGFKPSDHSPWKVLGEKWHFMPDGFHRGDKVAWKPELLRRLCKMIESTEPHGKFNWKNKVIVHYQIPGQNEPWASLITKRPAHVELILTGPHGRVALGRVASLGRESQVDTGRGGKDQVRMRFVTLSDLKNGNLQEFLKEHREWCR